MPVYTIVRHGQAERGEKDFPRKLTEMGRAQVRGRRVALGEPTFDLVIASPATRALETAEIIAGVNLLSISLCDALYEPSNRSDCEVITGLFAEIGYAPFRIYTVEAPYEFGRYTIEVGAAIKKLIPPQASQILVVGHAVLLNCLILSMIGEDDRYADLVLDANLGEAEGFRVVTSSPHGGKEVVSLVELLQAS